jgi:hypothetical protein
MPGPGWADRPANETATFCPAETPTRVHSGLAKHPDGTEWRRERYGRGTATRGTTESNGKRSGDRAGRYVQDGERRMMRVRRRDGEVMSTRGETRRRRRRIYETQDGNQKHVVGVMSKPCKGVLCQGQYIVHVSCLMTHETHGT